MEYYCTFAIDQAHDQTSPYITRAAKANIFTVGEACHVRANSSQTIARFEKDLFMLPERVKCIT